VHAPTVVNNYSTGCYNCGGWSSGGAAVAAGVTGLAVGAAIGATAAAAATPRPVYVAPAPYVPAPYVMGDVYPVLPAGCAYSPYNGGAYYNCGGTWFSPYYGANGMYYRVVPVP
jgi:hypothetical protein